MALENTLVQIRARSILGLLDLALVVVRKNPVTLGLAALFGIAPFAVLNTWLFATIPDIAPGVPLFLWMLESPWATAPLTLVLGGMMFGQRPNFGKVISRLFQASFSLIVVHGFLRIVLFFFITNRLAFANEMILLERGQWWKIPGRRGGELSSGRAGPLFWMGVTQVCLTYAFAMAFYVGISRVSEAIVAEDLTWDLPAASALVGWQFQLPIWLAAAFFAVTKFLVYIDQRVRLEGWEVELRLREVGRAMEEARRW